MGGWGRWWSVYDVRAELVYAGERRTGGQLCGVRDGPLRGCTGGQLRGCTGSDDEPTSGLQYGGSSPETRTVWSKASPVVQWMIWGAVLGTAIPAITSAASDPPKGLPIRGAQKS